MSENKTMKVIDKRISAADNIKPQVPTTAEIMMTAVRNGLGKDQLEVLERMFELDVRAKERAAQEGYFKAMADWKADAPEITKDRKVRFQTSKGETSYSHASLANIVYAVNTSMSPFGLRTFWTTEQPEGKVRVTCVCTHTLGYSESTSLIADADTSGTKNSIQAMGSTITYLQRYTLLSLTGLATHEQDTDAIPPEDLEPVNDMQYASLIDMLESTESDQKKFCSFFKIKELGELPATKFDQAMNMLKKKVKK